MVRKGAMVVAVVPDWVRGGRTMRGRVAAGLLGAGVLGVAWLPGTDCFAPRLGLPAYITVARRAAWGSPSRWPPSSLHAPDPTPMCDPVQLLPHPATRLLYRP